MVEIPKPVDNYFDNRRKIKLIKPLPEYNLLITFDNNEKRIVNLSKEIMANESVFNSLRNPCVFDTVFLNENGNPAWILSEFELEIDSDNCYLESEPEPS